jgi:ribose/xylose/arabinose/galactoside ABC-type transport system permease subunit
VDDRLKEQLLPAVMVFNFILAAYMSVRVIYPMLVSNRPLRSGTFFTHLLIGAAIGLIAAAVTFVITMRRK